MAKEVRSLDDLAGLRHLTAARIGMPRAGSSITTADMLKFDLDHARARDAVHLPFNTSFLKQEMGKRHWPVIQVHSRARDRAEYLQRPDLGRKLDQPSQEMLAGVGETAAEKIDLVVIVADGLSTRAVHNNAIPLLDEFLPRAEKRGWCTSALVLASQSRVALADEIGGALGASLSIILIGERPGLSAADSLGVYLTFGPRLGRTDANRNCISNIRPGGLSASEAAIQLENLTRVSFARKISGVELKADELLIESE